MYTLSRKPSVTVSCQAKSVHRAPPKNKPKTTDPPFDCNKLFTDRNYAATRYIGPIELATISGKGRGVLAKRVVQQGELLISSLPIGTVLKGPLGTNLRPDDLQQHLENSSLSPLALHQLNLLYDGSSSAAAATSFDNMNNLPKPAATKGFGASKQVEVAAREMTSDRLSAISRFNSWGNVHSELGVTSTRKEQQHSLIGIWPEFSMLNHSCAPNTVNLVVGDAMLVRATQGLAKGSEVTTSYLGELAGLPVASRHRALKGAYGFTCNCRRCQVEQEQPSAVSDLLGEMDAWLRTGVMQEVHAARDAPGGGDTAKLAEIRAQAQELTDRLEALLAAQEGLQPLEKDWLRASANGVYELLAVCSDDRQSLKPFELLTPLIEVYAKASDAHIFLLAECMERIVALHGKDSEQAKLALQQLLHAVVLRYGKLSDAVLMAVLGDKTMVECYLGRYNL